MVTRLPTLAEVISAAIDDFMHGDCPPGRDALSNHIAGYVADVYQMTRKPPQRKAAS